MDRHIVTVSAVTTAVGGCVIAIGSLMPWSFFDSMLFSIFARSGIDLGYGFVTLLAGIGLIAIGAASLVRPIARSMGWVALALAIVAIAVPLIARIDLDLRGDEGPLFVHPAGLTPWTYVIEVGGLVALVGALGLSLSLRSKSRI